MHLWSCKTSSLLWGCMRCVSCSVHFACSLTFALKVNLNIRAVWSSGGMCKNHEKICDDTHRALAGEKRHSLHSVLGVCFTLRINRGGRVQEAVLPDRICTIPVESLDHLQMRRKSHLNHTERLWLVPGWRWGCVTGWIQMCKSSPAIERVATGNESDAGPGSCVAPDLDGCCSTRHTPTRPCSQRPSGALQQDANYQSTSKSHARST